jgi:DNA-binding MarR family transcriptional regulator
MANDRQSADKAVEQSLPLLDYLARVGRRAYEETTEPGGLRPRHTLALKLLSLRGPQSQQGIGDALSLDPSNVVGLLNELEDRKLVSRRRDPADRRRHIVELSRAGQKQLDHAHRRMDKVEDDLLCALTPDERRTLHALLSRAAGDEPARCVPDDET